MTASRDTRTREQDGRAKRPAGWATLAFMRPARIALAAALCSGCSAQISDGRDPSLGGITTPDAGTVTGTGTGTGGGAGPAACSRRTVYLNFDGQALIQGPSDATLNQAQWMNMPAGLAPPYRLTDTGRNAAIQTIVDGVTRQLARFPITVTRTRPSGHYVMVVYGGIASAVGSNFGAAVNQLDCGDTRPSDVAWISDGVSPTQRVVNVAIGAIGFGLGLTATLDQNDCMCRWDNQCSLTGTEACKLGSPITRDPNANQRCAGLTTQDEVATFHKAFCE